MFLKNISARPIYVNTAKPKEGSFLLVPAGPAVNIPDEGINKFAKAYIDSLFANGDVVEVAAPKQATVEVEAPKRGRKPKEDAETVSE